MNIVILLAGVVLSSSLIAVGLPVDLFVYSTRQTQEEYLREHGYYGNCTYDNAPHSHSTKGKEGGMTFEGDYIVRVEEETENGESAEQKQPGDSVELLFWNAVRCFQRISGLPQTGVVNEVTRKEMEAQSKAPNSAVLHTRKKRFVTTGKWKKTNLTYYIANYDVARPAVNITDEVIRSEIQRAIKFWTDVSGLTVTELNSSDADIKMGFYAKDHKDGYPFDGSDGTLAHTFVPPDGDIHFDASEKWSAYTDKGLDLLYVTIHEFGHSLGIWHSDDRDSVMNPEVRSFDPNRQLAADDILAVQSLYGPPADQPPATPEPKP